MVGGFVLLFDGVVVDVGGGLFLLVLFLVLLSLFPLLLLFLVLLPTLLPLNHRLTLHSPPRNHPTPSHPKRALQQIRQHARSRA